MPEVSPDFAGICNYHSEYKKTGSLRNRLYLNTFCGILSFGHSLKTVHDMSFVSCLSAKLRASFFRSSPRPISASQLHASLHFHPWSIHLVVFKGSYFSFRMGDLVLGPASCLDAFSSYPFPAWLPSCTIGMITGAPAAGPSRSSRTEDSFPQISDAHNR